MPEQPNIFQQSTKENQPCRTCVDFKTWAKERRQNFSLSGSAGADVTEKGPTSKEVSHQISFN